ncbi:MAG: hypothetical protein ABFS19_06210 [Thermodesulfobacteriota bacterium]
MYASTSSSAILLTPARSGSYGSVSSQTTGVTGPDPVEDDSRSIVFAVSPVENRVETSNHPPPAVDLRQSAVHERHLSTPLLTEPPQTLQQNFELVTSTYSEVMDLIEQKDQGVLRLRA